MTGEEIIARLEGMKGNGYKEQEQAIDEAIEIIKSYPCEDAVSREAVLDLMADYDLSMGQVVRGIHDLPPVTPKPTECEDCVSRQAVLDVITANCIWENEYNLTSSRIKNAVEKLPSVTPKQRTGKIVMGGYDCDHYICSECSHDFGWFSKPDYKYCPHCGAKMEGESE